MKQTKELLAKQMTRKEFLQLAGMAVLALLGVSNFIAMLQRQTQKQTETRTIEKNQTGKGFGSSKFGV